MSTKIASLSDLRPDPNNANRGTQRGHSIIEASIRKHGAGRSGLAAKDGTMIAGSQTLEEMAALGMKVKPVHTTGDEWVVVIRDDVEPGSPEAILMGLEDNVATLRGVEWDPGKLAEIPAHVEVPAVLFSDQEWRDVVMLQPDEDAWASSLGGLPSGDRAPFQQMTFTLSDEQAEQVKAALEQARRLGPFVETGNENGNGNALARVCEVFLGER